MRRNPFFRRLGCLFLIFNFLGIVLFLAVLGLAANVLGFTHLPVDGLGWAIPLGVGSFVLMVGAIAWAGLGLRRMSVPLDDLLEAAGRVAEGDYSARVNEKGPPEVRSLTRAFNSMAARLQATAEQRRNLMADVTHELRTPLTIIQGNLEGMLDGMYPADEAVLKSILDETHMLSRLVDDLRTLALAESGALQLRREPTDLAALIHETVSAFRSQADAAGVTFDTVLASDNPPLNLDPERIREVLLNLIANALRYSPRGGAIRIRCEVTERSAERRGLVSVEDGGPGIAPQDLPHVFDRFYKASDSGGMGLGLSIARYIVEAHGGGIEARSDLGKGTTIAFTLPVGA